MVAVFVGLDLGVLIFLVDWGWVCSLGFSTGTSFGVRIGSLLVGMVLLYFDLSLWDWIVICEFIVYICGFCGLGVWRVLGSGFVLLCVVGCCWELVCVCYDDGRRVADVV